MFLYPVPKYILYPCKNSSFKLQQLFWIMWYFLTLERLLCRHHRHKWQVSSSVWYICSPSLGPSLCLRCLSPAQYFFPRMSKSCLSCQLGAFGDVSETLVPDYNYFSRQLRCVALKWGTLICVMIQSSSYLLYGSRCPGVGPRFQYPTLLRTHLQP